MRALQLTGFLLCSFLLSFMFVATVHAEQPANAGPSMNCATAPRACPGFAPLADVSNSSKLNQLYTQQTGGDLSAFINGLFKFALALGAIAAVLRLAYAGFLYMGQADMWSHKGEAKKIIGDVTLGLLLLLGIYLILYEINPNILKLNALQKIQQSPVQQTSTGTDKRDIPTSCANGFDAFGNCN